MRSIGDKVIEALVFYMFATVLVLSSIMVIAARNPVHAVLFLILAFFQAAGLFILLGAEFIAMMLVVVYVGAVAVLFLFVVMMLNIDFERLRGGMVRHAPLGTLIGIVLLAEFVFIYGTWKFSPLASANLQAPMPEGVSNTHALGQILYTDNIYLFQASGLILLVAMIGAIVLTLRDRPGVRRQNVSDQNDRDPKDVVKIEKVTTGTGVT